jgi:hypothetical protein
MSGQALRCAYCDEPLLLNSRGVNAWRVGNEFVCNEFCADGIAPRPIAAPERQSPPPLKVHGILKRR